MSTSHMVSSKIKYASVNSGVGFRAGGEGGSNILRPTDACMCKLYQTLSYICSNLRHMRWLMQPGKAVLILS